MLRPAVIVRESGKRLLSMPLTPASGSTPLYYFVAIPQFFPQPPGKRIMQVIHSLPAKAGTREVFTESNVSVRIPLKKDEAGASYDIYLGFQPDNEQLEYNRSHEQ